MSEDSVCRETRERIHEYVDGELGERAQVACEEHVTRCDQCKSFLVEVRSVKLAVAGKAARHTAPPHLAVRVRERLETNPRPGLWDGLRALLSRRPIAVGVALAVIVLFLLIVHPDRGGYVLARDLTVDCFDDHDKCADPMFLTKHVYGDDPEALSRALTVRAGRDVTVPDLSDAGCRLIEGHICSVRGEPAIHVYYKDAEGELISFFRVPGIEESGPLGKKVQLDVEAYVPPIECWKEQEEVGMHVLIWRSSPDCVSIVLGHEPQPAIEKMVRSCSKSSVAAH